MKKSHIFLGIIVFVLGIVVFLFATDFFLSNDQKADKEKERLIAKIEETKFSELPVITMDELEEKIDNGDDIIAYFSFVNKCGDSLLFQANSFNKYLEDPDIFNKIYVINLDIEAPEALRNRELRTPIAQRFQIDTWTEDPTVNPMQLFSPQLVHYNGGEIVDLVSWTPGNLDPEYGINRDLTDRFFENIK